MNTEIEHKCEGCCEQHIGEVKKVKVTDGYKDWGEFYYCDSAIKEDLSRGLSVKIIIQKSNQLK